jgi:hypothetical protein
LNSAGGRELLASSNGIAAFDGATDNRIKTPSKLISIHKIVIAALTFEQ